MIKVSDKELFDKVMHQTVLTVNNIPYLVLLKVPALLVTKGLTEHRATQKFNFMFGNHWNQDASHQGYANVLFLLQRAIKTDLVDALKYWNISCHLHLPMK